MGNVSDVRRLQAVSTSGSLARCPIPTMYCTVTHIQMHYPKQNFCRDSTPSVARNLVNIKPPARELTV